MLALSDLIIGICDLVIICVGCSISLYVVLSVHTLKGKMAQAIRTKLGKSAW